jgi:hypothetical protein
MHMTSDVNYAECAKSIVHNALVSMRRAHSQNVLGLLYSMYVKSISTVIVVAMATPVGRYSFVCFADLAEDSRDPERRVGEIRFTSPRSLFIDMTCSHGGTIGHLGCGSVRRFHMNAMDSVASTYSSGLWAWPR